MSDTLWMEFLTHRPGFFGVGPEKEFVSWPHVLKGLDLFIAEAERASLDPELLRRFRDALIKAHAKAER